MNEDFNKKVEDDPAAQEVGAQTPNHMAVAASTTALPGSSNPTASLMEDQLNRVEIAIGKKKKPITPASLETEVDTKNFARAISLITTISHFLANNINQRIHVYDPNEGVFHTLKLNERNQIVIEIRVGTVTCTKIFDGRSSHLLFDPSEIANERTEESPHETARVRTEARRKALAGLLVRALPNMDEDTRVRAILERTPAKRVRISEAAQTLAAILGEKERELSVTTDGNRLRLTFKRETGTGTNAVAALAAIANAMGNILEQDNPRYSAEFNAENWAKFAINSLIDELISLLPDKRSKLEQFRKRFKDTRETLVNFDILSNLPISQKHFYRFISIELSE